MDSEIRALVFDMDGLLFDSERVVRESWYLAGEQLGYPCLGDHICHTLGFNLTRRNQYFKEALGEEFPVEQFNQMTREIFYELKEKHGVPKKEGVDEILRYAKDAGFLLAVATSSRREYSSALLKESGIWEYFDTFVFGDMVAHAKPDPEIYLKACSALQVSPAKAIALEDSPNGIRAAYAAGMHPLMIPDLVCPDREIQRLCRWQCQSLLEVIEILQGNKN